MSRIAARGRRCPFGLFIVARGLQQAWPRPCLLITEGATTDQRDVDRNGIVYDKTCAATH